MRARRESGGSAEARQTSDNRGTRAKLTVTIEHLGGALCNLRGELTDWETGKRFVSGSQCKTWRDLRGKL